MKKINDAKLLNFTHHALSEHDLFSSMLYCKHLLENKESCSNEELQEFINFFFDGNSVDAIQELHRLYKFYRHEYFKCRLN